MIRDYFNSDQNDHMDYLDTLKPEQKCFCGWSELGKCYNCKAYPDKSAADKLAMTCPECKAWPHSPTHIYHKALCTRTPGYQHSFISLPYNGDVHADI